MPESQPLEDPDPRAGRVVLDELASILGTDQVGWDPDIMAAFSHDRAGLVAAGQPLALVRARTHDHVADTLRIASRHGIPVITRGAGTGLSGGANAADGCIILSTASMDRIIEIDVARRVAVVQCGVLNGDLAAAALAQGLWYAPDPSSRAISTIGGNIATNAGGACCLKYGVTGDHVAQLTAVLADGSTIRTGSLTRKNVTGLDLTRLLVGSEGTLAVITEATMRLRPAPRPPATLVAFFAAIEDAGAAVEAIEDAGEPSLLELMDARTIAAVEDLTHMGLDLDAGALLVAQSDGAEAGTDVEVFGRICQQHGATYVAHTTDPDEGAQLLAARHAALPAVERLGTTLLDDVVVPRGRLVELIHLIHEAGERHGAVVATFGHAGDGNLHPTLVYDPSSEASTAAARAAFDDIVVGALSLGGAVSGEHGIGQLKQPYLDAALGRTERSLMAGIKQAFDPQGILNPDRSI